MAERKRKRPVNLLVIGPMTIGFTQDDVVLLRKVADLYAEAKIELQDGTDTLSIVIQPRIVALRALADRIEALLGLGGVA